ncbi:MAG: hypothetical protein ABRQ26_14725 [Syntrophomonadaceae bacterium]
MSRKSMLGSVVVVALLLVGTFGGFVFAESAAGGDPGAKMKEMSQLFIDKLAENLGIDAADLEAAIAKTQTDLLADQVTAGSITQDEADKAIERGVEFGFMAGGPGGAPPDDQNGQGGKGKPAGPPPGESSDTNE